MTASRSTALTLFWVSVFSIFFAFVESSVVVYLRALYYPGGFSLPLKLMAPGHLVVELAREAATIVMLVVVGVIAGKERWTRFSYFIAAFGVWDIFYYVWLKVLLDWPESLFDWDILFLIPLPWIGPVIAPVLISILMIVAGIMIARRVETGGVFRPPLGSWLVSVAGALLVLYSFMMDTKATLHGESPDRYHYEMLTLALALWIYALVHAWRTLPRISQTQ